MSEFWVHACYAFLGPMSSKNYPVRGIERFSSVLTTSTSENHQEVDPDLEDVLSDNSDSQLDYPPPGEAFPEESLRLKRTIRDRDRDNGNTINKE